jgi:hypothetical protein
MGTLGVHMKGSLPWLVRWARPVDTIVFCPAMCALVYIVPNIIFLTAHFFTIAKQPGHAGSRAGSPVSVSLSYLSPLLNLSDGWFCCLKSLYFAACLILSVSQYVSLRFTFSACAALLTVYTCLCQHGCQSGFFVYLHLSSVHSSVNYLALQGKVSQSLV